MVTFMPLERGTKCMRHNFRIAVIAHGLFLCFDATGDASACVAGPLLGKGATKCCDMFTVPRRVQAAGHIYQAKICAAAQRLSTMVSAPIGSKADLGRRPSDVRLVLPIRTKR
jgi:hypothetical protein